MTNRWRAGSPMSTSAKAVSEMRCVQPLALMFVGAVMGAACAVIWATYEVASIIDN